MNGAYITERDFVRQPWENGGGFTTQPAVQEEGERWLWRLSLAAVAQSGPFSGFPGYERTIVLVEGEGMALLVDDAPPAILRAPDRPFVFDGGAKTVCRLLGGPVKDLNLMVDRERARGSLEVIAVDEVGAATLDSRWAVAYGLHGHTRITNGELECILAPGGLHRSDDARGERIRRAALDRGAPVALARIDGI